MLSCFSVSLLFSSRDGKAWSYWLLLPPPLPGPGAPRFSAALTCKLPDNEFRKTFYRGVRFATEGGKGEMARAGDGLRREREKGETEHALSRTTLRMHLREGEGEETGRGLGKRDARRRRDINHCLLASGSLNHLLSVKRESRDTRKSVTRARLKRLHPSFPFATGLRLIPILRVLSKIPIVERIREKN